ncbi:MAG: hypothetical protein ACYDCO_04605 [Armatimonadota bacterium]
MTFAAMREQSTRFHEAVRTIALWELRSFMRGWRAQLALFLCTAAIIGLGLFLMHTAELNIKGQYSAEEEVIEEMARVGRFIFQWLTLLEAGLIFFLMPLLSAGTIIHGRRTGTLESLLMTSFTLPEIVTGKLAGAAGFFAVVMLCALPIFAIVFFYGGVAPWELLFSQLMLLATAGGVGAVGLYCSARFRHLRAALPCSYLGAALIFAFLCPAIAAFPLAGELLWGWKQSMGTGSRGCTTFFTGVLLFIVAGLMFPLWLTSFLTSPAVALVAMFSIKVEGIWWAMLVLPTISLLLVMRLILSGVARRLRARE